MAGRWFRKPVDPTEVPNYRSVIKRPMDLGTIKTKLDRRVYQTPLEVCADIRLVFSNCAQFNREGDLARTVRGGALL